MTPTDFKKAGIRMYGRKHWRRELSVNLGMDASTIWRMSTRSSDVPHVVEVAVKGLLEKYKVLRAATRDERDRERIRKQSRQRSRKSKEKVDEPALEIPAAVAEEAGADHG